MLISEQWGLSAGPWLPTALSRPAAFDHPQNDNRLADGYALAVRRPPRGVAWD
jgi:hypothetical protein